LGWVATFILRLPKPGIFDFYLMEIQCRSYRIFGNEIR